jgi:hypothetical protein
VISNLYDVTPNKAGQISNFVTDSRPYGDWYQHFNGVDVTINARMRSGLTVQGGTSTGQNAGDNCAVRSNLPELSGALGPGLGGSNVSPTSPYCHVDYGMLTQLRGLASYIVPKVGVQASAVFQSKPGALLAANYAVPAATIAQSLGRPPSGNVTNVTVNLLTPGSMYGDRLTQLDLRLAKILKIGRSRTMVGIDLYNAMNSSGILTYNNTFVPGGPWLQPLTILSPRMLKFTAEMTF